jgi:hypothetical protein
MIHPKSSTRFLGNHDGLRTNYVTSLTMCWDCSVPHQFAPFRSLFPCVPLSTPSLAPSLSRFAGFGTQSCDIISSPWKYAELHMAWLKVGSVKSISAAPSTQKVPYPFLHVSLICPLLGRPLSTPSLGLHYAWCAEFTHILQGDSGEQRAGTWAVEGGRL